MMINARSVDGMLALAADDIQWSIESSLSVYELRDGRIFRVYFPAERDAPAR